MVPLSPTIRSPCTRASRATGVSGHSLTDTADDKTPSARHVPRVPAVTHSLTPLTRPHPHVTYHGWRILKQASQ
jgi:hypothetical protein